LAKGLWLGLGLRAESLGLNVKLENILNLPLVLGSMLQALSSKKTLKYHP